MTDHVDDDDDGSLIRLPDHQHKLYCWKVRNGAVVRAGETVAWAMRKDDSSAPAAPTTASGHKRPTKRRRPGPVEEVPTEKPVVPATTSSHHQDKSQNIAIVARRHGILRMGLTKDPLSIGRIEDCTHPAVVEGLCAVCGTPLAVKKESAKVTVSGGVTVSVSETEGRRMAELDSQRLRKQQKLSLVLDLDHTLVHATSDVRARQHLSRDDVRSLLLPAMEGEVPAGRPAMWMQHYVKLRPHVREFLETVLPLYEIGVYTAGTREYAEQVTLLLARHVVGAQLDQVDLEHLKARLYKAELDYQKQTVKVENGHKPESGEGETALTNGETSVDDAETKDGEPNKRKRVTFGEPQAESKTDRITSEEIDAIRNQLEEAESLEALAVDMRQRLFGSRVVSRTDVGDLGRDVKSLKRIFPCGGTMAAVLDDREDVWANAEEDPTVRRGEPPHNLLLVRPYHWDTFMGFVDINNAAGVDWSAGPDAQSSPGQSELDEQLLWSTDVLVRLHQRYYSPHSAQDQPTVPQILCEMRRQVLSGAQVVLSGLVPLHKQGVDNRSRPRPPVVRYVENLGGVILPTVRAEVTHVVGAKDGTDKILAARRIPGCWIVKPSWLMECVWTLTRRDERRHVWGPPVQSLQKRPLVDSQRDNSSSSDDEDDELAAEFENDVMEGE